MFLFKKMEEENIDYIDEYNQKWKYKDFKDFQFANMEVRTVVTLLNEFMRTLFINIDAIMTENEKKENK